MKKILFILSFVFASLISFSQGIQSGGFFSRVTDSATYVNSTYVTTSHANNYADIFYSVSSNLFWKWNGSSYELLSSGGGATAAGATGNVQYKSAGGGLQAEAALTYDSATNLLTVPSITAGSSTSLTDGAAITITGTKHTLTSDEATITYTLSQLADFQTTVITLNTATTTWTFPANTLCRVNGVASGDNTATLVGNSGDQWVMVIYKDGTTYKVSIANWEQ